VRPQQGQLTGRDERLELSLGPQEKPPIVDERVAARLPEEEAPTGCRPAERCDLVVAARKDPHALRVGVVEDPRLVGIVGVDRLVAIEMIGREVRDHADVGSERVDTGQLEGAHLEHHPIVDVTGARDIRGGRGQPAAHVASRHGAHARGAQQVVDQKRGGRLPIRPGNRDQCTREEPSGQLWLRDPLNSPPKELSEHRSVRRDSRAGDDDTGAGDPFDVVSSQLD
jgi:hypothetical protein